MNDITLKAKDAIGGSFGICYAIIDGNKEEMIYLKDIKAEIKKNKREIKVLGYTGTKHKASGWSGTGTATLYYSTSLFRQIMLQYIQTGKDTYFDLVISNEDPNSEIGRQTVVLKDVNIDNVVMARIDVESEELEEEISFTFNGADMLNSFTPVVGE